MLRIGVKLGGWGGKGEAKQGGDNRFGDSYWGYVFDNRLEFGYSLATSCFLRLKRVF